MTLSGYLQDLSQLTGECFLEFTDEKTESDSKSCQLELTTSTLAAMMLLNETVTPAGEAHEAHEADRKAASTISIFTDSSSEIQDQNLLLSPLTSTATITSSTISTRPSFDNNLLARRDSVKMSPPTIYPSTSLPPTSSTSPLTTATNQPKVTTLLRTNKPFMEQSKSLKMNSVTMAFQPLSSATALETRNTQAVIDDLKRPLHGSTLFPSKRKRPSISNHPENSENQVEETRVPRADGDNAFDEEDHEDDEVDEEEDQYSTKLRKISERKRRLNAVADSYLEDKIRKDIKKGKKSNVNNDEQSARWLVNESENRHIISSPREYQVELFELAKRKNVIAVLDTGSGKTLIAVLLLRHIFDQELEDRAIGKQKRISFFLVDSVALVFQQHAVLKANLDQPMEMCCGDMGTDSWKREDCEKLFKKNMVIVCTAEILRGWLHHGFISVDQINLLIFDEAHHAKKDHPYARIILDFYAESKKSGLVVLPKIFGMTASPVDAKTDVKKAASELEGMLHCEIATPKDKNSLHGYGRVTSTQELFAKYPALGARFKTELYKKIHERLKTNIVFRKPLLYAYEASRELGGWCADLIWTFCLSEDECKKLLAKTERQHHAGKVLEPLAFLEAHKSQLEEARNLVKSHLLDPPCYDPASDFSSNLSSKVVMLVRYLKERFERSTDDKCIVFVRQRYTARLLTKLFSHPSIRTPYLNVGSLVGTRSGDAGDLNVSFREQVLTMMNFRKGNINCLFATSVAEEGLDIPDCNLVIRFDLYTTLIQYIQSKGRARHANSRYIHMCEDRNQDHTNIIREVLSSEQILEKFCAALPESRKLMGNDFDMDYFLAKERSHRVYTVPQTGAKLTYKMSLMVLANFVDSLPRGAESNLTADYVVTPQNKQFVCEVILPAASPLRGAIGRPASTKQVAKCSAAFETCLLLRKGKYLDQWLLPTFTKQLPAMRNALLAVDSKKREAYDMRTKPALWSVGGVPEALYVTILNLAQPESLDRPSQPLALLTRQPLPQLPSFILHFGGGQNSPVLCTSLTQPLNVTSAILHQINTFTVCIFDDVFSKEYESNPSSMPYFLAPIQSKHSFHEYSDPINLIAWHVLEDIEDYQLQWSETPWDNKSWQTQPDELFQDRFIVDPYDGSRKLWTIGVAHQYKPLDPVPQNSAPRKGTRKNNDNIMEYSCSLWSKARARRTFDENQRVVEARYISLRRNLLDEFDIPVEETPKRCFVILEPLKISPLPTTVVAFAYLFPAIIHRVESYLIALEACDLLHLKIRPDLALEAMTKDSDNSEDHGAEQINFQRGMGNNYERLEFLGDCFLKMATSISLYGLHPDNDEYRYHVDRMLLICNKNLCNNAVKLRLYEFIRSQSFNRRAWYPEGLVLKKGKTATAPNSHRLGDKTIADVCEALIGAALLTGLETKNMDNAVRAVSELVSSENHNVTAWSDYYSLYKMPKFQKADAHESQKLLARQVETKHAYNFRYPRLLRSAFVHPSYPFSWIKIPSYQRLEFLGDSLLDMACVNFLFHNFPDKDPQWLTEHKMAMVSNQFLGALCVSLSFHTHLLLFNNGFVKQIADYVTDITEAKLQAEEDAIRAGKRRDECSPDYWISVRQPPKCLPDVVEAYIGAIFVDSEYDYAEVERFFEEHIKWYFLDMTIYDTFANKHPTTFLTRFLQENMGCMDWTIIPREIKQVDGSKPAIMAMVIIHGEVVADSTAESSRYAKVGAAKKALEVLECLPLQEFRAKFRCCCTPDELEADIQGVVEGEELHGTAA